MHSRILVSILILALIISTCGGKKTTKRKTTTKTTKRTTTKATKKTIQTATTTTTKATKTSTTTTTKATTTTTTTTTKATTTTTTTTTSKIGLTQSTMGTVKSGHGQSWESVFCNFEGNDIQNYDGTFGRDLSLNDCIKACVDNSQCTHYVYSSKCYLKSDTGVSPSNVESYTDYPTFCGIAPSVDNFYQIYSQDVNCDFSGSTSFLSTETSFDSCRNGCSTNDECYYFSYDGSSCFYYDISTHSKLDKKDSFCGFKIQTATTSEATTTTTEATTTTTTKATTRAIDENYHPNYPSECQWYWIYSKGGIQRAGCDYAGSNYLWCAWDSQYQYGRWSYCNDNWNQAPLPTTTTTTTTTTTRRTVTASEDNHPNYPSACQWYWTYSKGGAQNAGCADPGNSGYLWCARNAQYQAFQWEYCPDNWNIAYA